MRPTETEIAWAAGLFEGEGCMFAYPRGKRGSGAVAILDMSDADVVERFAEIVGRGNLHKPRIPEGQSKPMYRWAVYEAAHVCEVIEMLMPYFGKRRWAKAQEVLAIAREIGLHKGKRTHCRNGHPYQGDNLVLERIVRSGQVYFARRCKCCRAEQTRSRSAKAKEAIRG